MNGLRALTSGSPVGQTVANAGATRDAAAVRVPAVTGPQPPMLDDDVIRPAAPTCPAGLIGGAAYAGASGPPLMIIEGLERIFRTGERPAVDGVTLDVYEGELLALLGPSGCGKTTTLRMIGGFEQPDAGRIFMRGHDITDLPPEKRGIGFVFQDYALFPHLDVFENVRFGLNRLPRRQAEARVREMLELVGLSELAKRRPHELSGGQQQRVALARTLALAPSLVLMDEPFSNLDAAMRVETRQEVRALLKEAGSAGILVTHDQEEALALADRIVVMEAGKVCQIGTPDEIYRHPVSSFVASFIGRSNIVTGKAEGLGAETPFGRVELSKAVNGTVDLAVRPEQILLEPHEKGEAEVIGREYRGHDQLYWVRKGERRLLVISGPAEQIEVGARVNLRVCDCVVPINQDIGTLIAE
ncbi:MAG: iron(III) transport system ATP-binding protein [Saliniramus fredricksonii]|uniref:Iron(III) transport system ATP-binding protein n=1 Tax=Saliniramus fredricksonii TaxID=1653334 RepID=A0A0P7X7L1_9HYPH|nr:ABC transporter ATP-binding protein [Saliniramus fredricksonii]KPQ11084.1 MAG: iron(III) transport system ATP-binding protein [Saliniramus fredricksonii]SCC78080.1 iron(III) transport system ATP-binding protein [Saliniramus fredricksonii]